MRAGAPLPRLVAAEPGPDELGRLLVWATLAGAEVDAIALGPSPLGGRGVFARRAVAAEAPLAFVPRHLMVTDGDVAAGPIGAQLAARAEDLGPQAVMAAWLADARADPESPWRPYVDALPIAIALPQFRPIDERLALVGTRALAAIEDAIALVVADAAVIAPLLPSAADLATYAWARAAIRSRCFGVDGLVGAGRALVPVIELCNCGPPTAHWGYDAARAGFALTASQALAEGDEIVISYGGFDNATLMSGYGFAVADNPDDEVGLCLAGPTGVEVWPVAATVDDRLRAALAAAEAVAGGWGVALFATAVDAARAVLGVGPAAVGEPAWQATCATVRAGERAVLDALAEAAAHLAPVAAAPSPAAWRALAAALADAPSRGAALARTYAAAFAPHTAPA